MCDPDPDPDADGRRGGSAVSTVSPFRLFGRGPAGPDAAGRAAGGPVGAGRAVDGAVVAGPGADADAVAWAAGPWSPGPDIGSADARRAARTRHARPGAYGPGDDPLTDPFGFPPILPDDLLPAPVPVAAEPAARPRLRAVPRPAGPDPQEAAALAGAFAADYLSWDEADPARRGRALAEHLATPIDGGPVDPTLLGWDGRGRQRADFALPGLVRADGDDRVLVDVRVRVTPYRAVGGDAADRVADHPADHAADHADEPDVPGVPAAAPAPTGRGWRGGAASWVRLSVPVVREGDRLVVDADDEASDHPARERAPGRAPGDGPDAFDDEPGGDTEPGGSDRPGVPGPPAPPRESAW